MLKVGKRVVRKTVRIVGRTVTEANLAATHLPGVDTIPLRRMGFGLAMALDPRGATLLDVLGDDLDARARTMDRFMSNCSDDELHQLLEAFQEAASRRAARHAHLAGGV